MRYTDFIPSDLDGETALLIVDLLHLIAEEILSRSDGAIRIYYNQIDDIRRAARDDQTQIPLPLADPFSDLPF